MWKIPVRINKNLVYAIPLTFFMVYPMMCNLNIKHLQQGLHPKSLGIAQFINFAYKICHAGTQGKNFSSFSALSTIGVLAIVFVDTVLKSLTIIESPGGLPLFIPRVRQVYRRVAWSRCEK